MVKKSVSEKEKELLDKIAKAKEELSRLQEKQKTALGHLAYKHNLHLLDKKILENEFKELVKKHKL